MTRYRWTGLAGVLFGALMLIGVISSGTTPNSTDSGAIERYTTYWSDSGHQNRAGVGAIVLTYACVMLALFSAGLRGLLARVQGGGLSSVVLSTGTAAAALLAAGGALLNGPGVAAAETAYRPEGNEALLVESMGYYTVATSMMLAGAMAVAFSIANRSVRVVPQWTIVLSGLLGVISLGSIFLAWVGFMLLPLWSIVIGVCLLVVRQTDEPDVEIRMPQDKTSPDLLEHHP